MRIYIAGPITGRDDYFEKFEAAEKLLERAMIGDGPKRIVNPAYMAKTIKPFSHRKQVEICIELLKECDTLFLLEGWEYSLGAQAEYGYALGTGKKIVEEKEVKDVLKALDKAHANERQPVEQPVPLKEKTTYTKKCEVCGKEFETQYKHTKLCSPECKKLRLKENKIGRALKEAAEEYAAREELSGKTEENMENKPEETKKKRQKIRPSRAFEIEAKAREQGKHYADLQKEETLRMVEKIGG